jgi:hypothetical protein
MNHTIDLIDDASEFVDIAHVGDNVLQVSIVWFVDSTIGWQRSAHGQHLIAGGQ